MADIYEQLESRILLLDGGFGTMVQQYGLTEEDYRGERFREWPALLKGCNDLLALTRPEAVREIHVKYLQAGADIIETDSFNANAVSLADYGLEAYAYEMSRAAAAVARSAADEFTARNPQKPRFVAGSMGPTNRTASMSADVANPAAREVTFAQLVEAYTDQARGLLDGGADILLVETIFDTLNAKAALYAIDALAEKLGRTIRVMASGTLADASGRTLSGQTVEAFCTSLSHAQLLSLGLNCAYGAKQLLPYLERLAETAPFRISAHPNAGLPNVMGGYDETPEMFAEDVGEYMRRGLVNIVGGCCGTTPAHIFELSKIACNYAPRPVPAPRRVTTLSGLEPLRIAPETNFVNVGERTNVAGSAKFARLIREGNYEEALSVARAQVDAGAQIVDVCMDDGMIDGVEAMRTFLNLMASEPEIARVPTMIDSSKWEVLAAGLEVTQGKAVVNSISLKEGEAEFLRRAREIHRYGAAAVVMLFDEQGQADTCERKIEVASRAYRLLTDAGFPAEDIIFDPNILAVATGKPALRKGVGRRVEPLVRLPRQQRRARSDALGVPLPRHPRGHGHGHRQPANGEDIQRDRTRTAPTRRGRDPLPPGRRRRTAHRICAAGAHHGRNPAAGPRRMARGNARRADRPRHAQGRSGLHRAGRAGGLRSPRNADGRDRHPADARHGAGRHALRRG